ncbi:hypothetical protein [Shimia sp.]|uniref:hypothetical protein n=1 Tax=Shimia sp. TaxID=1954381 RepID=UPI0035634D75
MKSFLPLTLAALAACAPSSRHFADIAPLRVSAQGSDFELRRRQQSLDLVQVIRVNGEYAPRLGQQLGRRAEIAVERAYGCPVRRIFGDAAVMLAVLDCGAADGLARIGHGP